MFKVLVKIDKPRRYIFQLFSGMSPKHNLYKIAISF